MTFQYTRPMKEATAFGVFHNLDCQGEEVGYIWIHIFTARLGFTWQRRNQ